MIFKTNISNISSFLIHKSINVSNCRRKRFVIITGAMIAAAVAKAIIPAVAAVAGTSAAVGVGISLAVANKKKENCYHNLI